MKLTITKLKLQQLELPGTLIYRVSWFVNKHLSFKWWSTLVLELYPSCFAWCNSQYLKSNSMFLLPLHIIDVPGNSSHCDNGFLHHLVARGIFIKVLSQLLWQIRLDIRIIGQNNTKKHMAPSWKFLGILPCVTQTDKFYSELWSEMLKMMWTRSLNYCISFNWIMWFQN